MYNVLIIDDEPWSRTIVKKLGDWDGLQLKVIGEAEDGSSAIQLIEERKPEIVVTDMRMPGLDGAELLKELEHRFPDVKLIVMSGYDDFTYMQQAIRSNATDYLLKPISQDELNRALKRCIEELNRTSEPSLYEVWNKSLALSNRDALNSYVTLREQVEGQLLELNKSALLQTFMKLEQLLNQAWVPSDQEYALALIGHDFKLMLEQFVAGNEQAFKEYVIEQDHANEPTQWKTIPQAMQWLSEQFVFAIDVVEKALKHRRRLNIAEVQDYIDRHYQAPLSLELLASRFYVSKEYLSRIFKMETGENVTDYILRKRMEKAKELIQEQGLSIKHAAMMTGYDDLAYFYRVFKKIFGQTPGELRKKP